MKVFTRAQASGLADTFFVTWDVSEIFVRVFRWVLAPPQQPFFDHPAFDHGVQSARLAAASKRARTAFGSYLCMPGALERGTLALTRFAASRLHANVVDELARAGEDEVFPVVLGLLDALDQDCGNGVLDSFYQGGRSGASIPVRAGRAFPRPWPSFGGSAPESRPPASGLPIRFLRLERYFSHLAVSDHSHDGPITPALHPLSSRFRREDRDQWTIAMASILGGGDVEWELRERTFSGTRYRDGAAERIRRRLEWVLECCAEVQADFILIPELNLDAEIRDAVSRRLAELRPRWRGEAPTVFAGALHQAAGSAFRNRPLVWKNAAPIEWDYAKTEPLVWQRRKGDLTEDLLAEEARLVAIDVPVGRLGVVICKDFLTANVQEALTRVRANVGVVLAMTNEGSVGDFASVARSLAASSGMVTLFCNSSLHHRAPFCRNENAEKPLGFVHPNTRIRLNRIARHFLDPVQAEAVVGVYRLQSTLDGLKHSVDVRWWDGGAAG